MTDDWQRYRHALAGRRLPAALVDLDAFERNVDRLVAPVRAGGKGLRVATKSLRCPTLVRAVCDRAGATTRGLMTYTAAETAWWAEQHEPWTKELVLAYPTVGREDLQDLVAANAGGARAAMVVDDEAQVRAAAEVGRAADVPLPLVVEVDMAWRPLGGALHVGVRRSPLHDVDAVVRLVKQIAVNEGVTFAGVMGYDAQLAGVTDRGSSARRAMKRMSRRAVEKLRADVASELAGAGLPVGMFNGGGTGSVMWAAEDPTLTEVTVGSGFVGPHLFDRYKDVVVEPAAYFALQVTRRPAPGVVTCHGGGYVASGEAGEDRLPLPALPAGLALLGLEGAGEVQTPLRVPAGMELQFGDPVLFRHAKAGELAEHFDRYLLVRGDRVVDEVPTWRGLGLHFLG